MAPYDTIAVYLVANPRNGETYLGVTSDLVRRIGQHRAGSFPGGSAARACRALVWFEPHTHMHAAIRRERQLKRSRPEERRALIASINPGWQDLAEGFLGPLSR